MNLLQISEALKGVPKQFLVQEATQPSGRYPQYMIVAELSRRTSMEKQFAAAEAQMPAQTVAEQKVAEATAPMPTSTTMAMGQMQPNMPSGIRSVGAGGGMVNMLPNEPRGQETMGMPAAVRMYEGSRINMDNGGFAGSEVKSEQYYSQLRDELKRLIDEPDDVTANMGDTGRSTLTSQVGTSRIANKRERINQIYKELSENPNRITTTGELRGFEQSSDPIGSKSDMAPSNIAEVGNQERLQAQLDAAETEEERQAVQNTIDKRDKAKADYLKEAERKGREEAKIIDDRIQDSTLDKDAIDKIKSDLPSDEELKKKFKELKDKVTNRERPTYEMPKVNFEEVFKDADTFKAELQSLRGTDYLKKVEDANKKERDSIEKDRKQAIPLSLIEAGLNIATTASPNLLGAIAGGSKAGLKKWTAIQKDVKAAEKEAAKAENALLLARDARQEGDIKAFKAYEMDYKNSKRKAEEFNAKGGIETQKLIAESDRLETRLLGNLDVAQIKAIADKERTNAQIKTQKEIAKIQAKSVDRRAFVRSKNQNVAQLRKDITSLENQKIKTRTKFIAELQQNASAGEELKMTPEMLGLLRDIDIKIATKKGEYNGYVGGVTITPDPSTDDFLEYKPQ